MERHVFLKTGTKSEQLGVVNKVHKRSRNRSPLLKLSELVGFSSLHKPSASRHEQAMLTKCLPSELSLVRVLELSQRWQVPCHWRAEDLTVLVSSLA